MALNMQSHEITKAHRRIDQKFMDERFLIEQRCPRRLIHWLCQFDQLIGKAQKAELVPKREKGAEPVLVLGGEALLAVIEV